MKVMVEERDDEGLSQFLGKRILVMTAGYFYEGKLVGINETCIKLTEPGIVYDTGKWSDKTFLDLQLLPSDSWYVQLGLIESFGKSKND